MTTLKSADTSCISHRISLDPMDDLHIYISQSTQVCCCPFLEYNIFARKRVFVITFILSPFFTFFSFLYSNIVSLAISTWDFLTCPLTTFSTARCLRSVYRNFSKFTTFSTNFLVLWQPLDFRKVCRYKANSKQIESSSIASMS